jgi:magnesium transporter
MRDVNKLIDKMNQVDTVFELAPVLKKMPIVEVGEILNQLDEMLLFAVLDQFTPKQQGLIFAEFSMKKMIDIFQTCTKKRFAIIFENMPSEIRADLYQHLTQEEQADLLPYLSKSIRENVIQLSAYPPDSAGGIMSTDFSTVKITMTCQEAMEKVRNDAPSKRTVYYIYVLGNNEEFIGFITLKDLILAKPSTRLDQIVHQKYIAVKVDDDQEEVARLIEKYDLVAIPVLNRKNQLVGIVTHDDAIEIIRAEQTEDMEKIMGILPGEEGADYNTTSVWQHFSKRVVWLVSLAAFGVISGIIIHRFENLLDQLIILALYMPMVADTGGNSGSQSATVVIRAMALKQFSPSNWLRVIWKETRVAFLVAICLGILAFLKVLFLSWETTIPSNFSLFQIALVIASALSLQVITATMIGAGLPLLVKKLGGDPAVVASPAITTVVDITGLLIYFGVVTTFLAGFVS